MSENTDNNLSQVTEDVTETVAESPAEGVTEEAADESVAMAEAETSASDTAPEIPAEADTDLEATDQSAEEQPAPEKESAEEKPAPEEESAEKAPAPEKKPRKKSVLKRMTLREIRRTFGRHFAIFAIIALGVGFFSGLRIASPVFVHTMDRFYQKSNFFDMKVLSTIGWDDTDVETIEKEKDVLAAEGAWQIDVIIDNPNGDALVYKAHSLTKDVNKLRLKKGSLPKKEDEILLDADNHKGFKIGDKVTFSEDNEEETLKQFKGREFTITGFADSPLYTNFERGTTAIGSGTSSGFMYLPKEAFTGEAYTEMYVKLNDDKEILSDEYDKMIEAKTEKWEETSLTAAQARADRLRGDAQAQLDAAKQEMEAKKKEIDDQLSGQKQQLEAARAQLDASMNQIEASDRALNEKESELDRAQTTLEQTKAQLDATAATLASQEASVARQAQDVQNAIASGAISGDAAAQEQAKVAAAQQQVAASRASYEQSLAQYNEQKAQYDAGRQAVSRGRADIASKTGALDSSFTEYDQNMANLSAVEGELSKQVTAAEEKVNKAQKEIDKIGDPETFVLDRNTNVAYTCFASDSKIVQQVASIFPLFFILVAALVCITTMARMVDEQRTQIGILKGLGYRKKDITKGFMTYSGSAALFGSVLGYIVGILLFPTVIWRAYRIMYISVPLRYKVSPLLFFVTLAAALICSLGTSWAACRGALAENAASLMRPKAPKAGKRLLLEYIPGLWSHLPFMRKVSLRNIFRYKKRLLMMVLGVGGCTALLLTGFGIKDSIAGFAGTQFDDIQIADAEVSFRNGQDGEIPHELRTEIAKVGGKTLPFIRGSWDMLQGKKVKSVDLIAPYDVDNINHYFILRTPEDKALKLPGENEALVSVSLAERYSIKKGDKITLRNEDMKKMKVKVTGILENHVYNYVIVSPETVRAATESANVNSLYLNFPKEADVYKSQSRIAGLDDVSSVMLYKDFKNRLVNMMSALNYIVLLIIASASALAFVVSYNLTNINIIERTREIATIKVLGFDRSETYDYILQENMILTGFGAFVGLFMGVGLHRFVMSKIVVDLVYFPVHIRFLSFIFAVVLTFIFTAIVNLVMSRRMEKINMAESLKAVE